MGGGRGARRRRPPRGGSAVLDQGGRGRAAGYCPRDGFGVLAMANATTGTPPRQRVPASERRDALIEAAVHEFALGGLHGTAVDRIARRVGVAQPYVFSFFASKKQLFL